MAGAVVLRYPGLELVAQAWAEGAVDFAYVPGLLSFREAPVMELAVRKLAVWPDVLLVDGQGLAHPRRFGLACHLGVALDMATIGCGKSRLVGQYDEPGRRKGCQRRLMDRGEVIGRVVRTREGVKCVYVSVGHKVELDQAAKLVLGSCGRYRLTEPIRAAHRFVSELRSGVKVDKR